MVGSLQKECASSDELIERLQSIYGELTPELRKGAVYLIENQSEVGISSIRQLAGKIGVKPNTLVRLAHTLGFKSFERFREIFRAEIRSPRESFPDRARWLQSLSHEGKLGQLYAGIVSDSIGNLEDFYASTDYGKIRTVAKEIVERRAVYVLGVGVVNAIARNFAYLANMAVSNVRALPDGGTLPVDGLVRAGADDMLIAMTFRPYRREIVEAVETARSSGVRIVAISDGLACPIMAGAAHQFVVPTATTQFFISTIALTAFFEMLQTFIIAEAGGEAIASIETFHARRKEEGIYIEEWRRNGSRYDG